MSKEDIYNKYKDFIDSVENKDDLIDMIMLLEKDSDKHDNFDLDTLFMGE